jgi:hypothetical protein
MPRKPESENPPEDSDQAAEPLAGAPGQPSDVAAIRKEIRAFFKSKDAQGRLIGKRKWGVYAFYDYDDEPIYVGQTREGLGSRIGRHLTNQRTDAVAMNVLDPFEVAKIRVWPLDLAGKSLEAQREYLDRAEYTVFQRVLKDSKIGAVLNEKVPPEMPKLDLPEFYERRIIPDDIFPHRKHPDIRIARRASTIAALARVISERKVSHGLRQTLLTQARRLELLAATRLKDFPEVEVKGEEDED